MRELTERQRRILDWVQEFRARHGMPPTVREIGRHFRMASSSAFGHLRLIEKKGYLRRGELGARSLHVIDSPAGLLTTRTHRPASPPLPLTPSLSLEGRGSLSGRRPHDDPEMVDIPEVGRVAAGEPLPVEENADRTVKLDRALLGGPRDARHFILRVAGDSMVEAGILDGDRVVVRRQATAENGQVVVALVDGGEATVKRFFREGGRVRLQPANRRMKPIYPEEVAVQGAVVCVLRTYN